MGANKSRQANQELTETGVVNSNFVVEETAIQCPNDLKIMFYIIFGIVVIKFVLKIYVRYTRYVKRKTLRRTASIGTV